MGLTFPEIAKQINVSPQRAQQLYSLHRFFKPSSNSPFRDLSTRSRNFLNRVATARKWPENWEEQPAYVTQMFSVLREMPVAERAKYRLAGNRTHAEIDDFLGKQGSVQEDFGGEIEAKEFTAPANGEDAMQEVAAFFNQNDLMGEFKVWPKGTFKGPLAENNEFTVTLSGFLGDAWAEGWSLVDDFDNLIRGLGFNYEMGTPTRMDFFRDVPT